MQLRRFLERFLGVALILLVAFVGGVMFRDLRTVRNIGSFRRTVQAMPSHLALAMMTMARGQGEDNSPYRTYADVLATLKANYYDAAAPTKEIDTTQMTYNAIRGMLGAVHDRYTRFIDPTAYKEMTDDQSGEFGGIGAGLDTNKQGQIYIRKVIVNTPAMKAKLMVGDIILKVDGHSAFKMKDTDVVKLIRGEPGTKVTLSVLRKEAPKPVSFVLVRDIIQQEVIHHAMVDPVSKIGYIDFGHFTDSTFNLECDNQIDKALTDLQSKGARGIILDLRENPGGLLEEAQKVASRFIASGPIVYIKDGGGTQVLNVDPRQHDHLHFPLVVLVNGNSASASEIVSGAIKDTQSGILVGETTFGKGLVQTIMPQTDGSAVLITTQHYYTARMHDINHKGISPDVSVTPTDADIRGNYNYVRAHPDAIYDLQYDRQLQVALKTLKQRMQVASARKW